METPASQTMDDEMELDAPADRAGDDRQPSRQPFSDSDNLNNIPRTRPEDPPYRNWWVDDSSDSSQDR